MCDLHPHPQTGGYPPPPANDAEAPASDAPRLSYKYQRLRERLRLAIESGELRGKLPGERTLAERFGVNAKTLGKALTDLATLGVLERTVGRGTYVLGQEGGGLIDGVTTPGEGVVAAGDSGGSRGRGVWLILCPTSAVRSPIVRRLMTLAPPGSRVYTDPEGLRPGMLARVRGVLDVGGYADDGLTRDLAVRGVPTVRLGPVEPIAETPQGGTVRGPGRGLGESLARRLTCHFVTVDVAIGVAKLVRRAVLLHGHRRIAAVEGDVVGCRPGLIGTIAREVVRHTAADVEVVDLAWPGDPSDLLHAARRLIETDATAVLCDGAEVTRSVLRTLRQAGRGIPESLSVAGVGLAGDPDAVHPAEGRGLWFESRYAHFHKSRISHDLRPSRFPG